MSTRLSIVGLGEVLFDVRDGELLLGGAPLNFCFHAHQLVNGLDGGMSGGMGAAVLPVSSVGRDDLGDRLLEQVAGLGLDVSGITRHPSHPTGRVLVEISATGHPAYTIESPSAWDDIDPGGGVIDRIASAGAVCFGTLAQRSPAGRKRISEIVARCGGERVLDVNLREGFIDLDVLADSVALATILKLNEHELPVVASVLGVATDRDEMSLAHRVLERCGARLLVLTRGSRGTAILSSGQVYDGALVQPDFQPGHDTVGAGDATTAAVVVGHLVGAAPGELCDFANAVGAFVASRRGATPLLPERLIAQFRRMARRGSPLPDGRVALADVTLSGFARSVGLQG